MTTETQPDQAVSTETTESQPQELSLRDNLEANLEISEKGEESVDLSKAAKTLAGARKGKAPIDKVDDKTITESERVGKENEAKAKRTAELAAMTPEARAAAEADDKKKADEAAAASSIEAPAHWPAAVREMFAKQSPDAKKFLLDRHKAMEADYTKKMQELSPMRRMQEELDDIFKDEEAEMRQLGVTRAQAIRELVGAHKRWKADPVAYVKWVAGMSKLDLKGLVEGAAAADPAGESPTVKALREQVSTLTGQVKAMSGAQTEQDRSARMNEVTQFAEEKDDQGKLKRPYFDEVAKDIAQMIHVSRANGQALSLQDAYDRAVYANPTTRGKLLTEQDTQRRSKEEAERKAKADAAKKAGFDVKGEGAATQVAASTGTIRESLEKAFDLAEGRA